MATTLKQKKIFDAGSPGFLYTLIVGALTIFAAAGVQFPDNPGDIAGEVTTLLSTGGFFAIIGVIVASVAFPIWNAAQKGNLSFGGIFRNTLTWVSIGNILFAAIALTGFVLPDGTVEAIVGAIAAKDWTSLISLFVTTILPAIVRFVKERNR